MKTHAIVLFCCVASVGPATVTAAADLSEEQQRRLRDLIVLELLHDAAKKGRLTGKTKWQDQGRRKIRTFADKDAKNAELELLEFAIRNATHRLSQPPIPTPTIEIRQLRTGQIGVLALDGRTGLGLRVMQIVGPNDMLTEFSGIDIWVTGFSTSNLVDDDRVRVDVPVSVAGTKQYTTVLGATKQVWHLEAFDESEFLRRAEKQWIATHSRSWKSGDYSCDGWLCRVENHNALIVRADTGDVIEVPIKKLSAECQQVVAQRRNAESDLQQQLERDFWSRPDSGDWKQILARHS